MIQKYVGISYWGGEEDIRTTPPPPQKKDNIKHLQISADASFSYLNFTVPNTLMLYIMRKSFSCLRIRGLTLKPTMKNTVWCNVTTPHAISTPLCPLNYHPSLNPLHHPSLPARFKANVSSTSLQPFISCSPNGAAFNNSWPCVGLIWLFLA